MKIVSGKLNNYEVTIRPAGLYTNTYVEGLGQVPGKKYIILYRPSCRMNSHCVMIIKTHFFYVNQLYSYSWNLGITCWDQELCLFTIHLAGYFSFIGGSTVQPSTVHTGPIKQIILSLSSLENMSYALSPLPWKYHSKN